MRLIFSRHGNTFSPGDTPVWVGRRTDLPLVAKGVEQARLFGRALGEAGIVPAALFCGPLQRTLRHAEIATEEAGLSLVPRIDTRLLEIDYGTWEGRSSRDIADGPGADELEAWETHSRWPDSAGWVPSEQAIADGLADFIREVNASYGRGDDVIAVASNGVLRYALRLVPGAFESYAKAGTAKVATGNICILESTPDGFAITAWNAQPETSLFAV